jgi:hypothetical protein
MLNQYFYVATEDINETADLHTKQVRHSCLGNGAAGRMRRSNGALRSPIAALPVLPLS